MPAYATPQGPAHLTSLHIRQAKNQRKLVMLTAYDYPSALLADAAGLDMLLVGDSLGMTMLGQGDTLGVTMEHMIHHSRAVSAARSRALVVCDMPFMSYESDPKTAVRNAGRLMAEGGARAVKLEGAWLPQVRAMVAAGIPVMGHLGLTPQHVAALGGFRVQGRTAQAARKLLEDSLALQEAGCFSLVLECVPQEVAAHVTAALEIPTIGIGAGAQCDGQVLVYHDVLGLTAGHTPRFVKQYAALGAQITEAVAQYASDVRDGVFPAEAQSFTLAPEEREEVDALLR